MIETTIARRYAKALFELASTEEELELFRTQIEDFGELLGENPHLLDILSNRFLDMGARLSIVDELITRLMAPPTISQFIKLLIKKGRIQIFQLITSTYHDMALARQNKIEASVTSSRLLDDSIYEKIVEAVHSKTGKQVILKKEIKPEVVAGLRVRVKNVVYDGTVQTELDRLCERMNQQMV